MVAGRLFGKATFAVNAACVLQRQVGFSRTRA
jgi:hypothetical protein